MMARQPSAQKAQTEKIFAWRRGFNAMHLIDIGVEVGLFKALAAAPAGLTSAALAQQLGLHAHFVNVWCTTAYSFELLEADETTQQFKLAPFIDKILASPGHPRYLGGYVKLGTEFATEDFRRCVESFKSGKTIPFQGRGEKFANTIADGTMGLQMISARKILPELPGLGDKLANGGGYWKSVAARAIIYCNWRTRFPTRASPVSTSMPIVLNVARAKLAKAGVENRVSVFEGDIALATQNGTFRRGGHDRSFA